MMPQRRPFRRLGALLRILAGLLAASHLGALLPAADSLAVLRPHLVAALLAASAFAWRRYPRLAAASALAALVSGGLSVLSWQGSAAGPAGPVKLYQKNLHYTAWPRYPLADDILQSGADLVTLQEVSPFNRKFMFRLFDGYPHQQACRFEGDEVAVLSRLPFVPGTAACGQDMALALVQVEMPGGRRLWVAAVHLPWPWPFDQARQSRKAAKHLAELDGPIVVGGDFNMVPWGASLADIAAAARAQRLGGYAPTYTRFRLLLLAPIDHVLLPKESRGMIETRSAFGSDHLGLLASFSLR